MKNAFFLDLFFILSVYCGAQNFKVGTFMAFEVKQYDIEVGMKDNNWIKTDRVVILSKDNITIHYETLCEEIRIQYIKTIDHEKYVSYQLMGINDKGNSLTIVYSCPKYID